MCRILPRLVQYPTGGNSINDVPNIKSTDDTEVPNIRVREVESAVNQMKDYDAPGTDDITSDTFKIGAEVNNKRLVKLYN